MKGFAATFIAIFVICAFAACESSTPQNDGVTRFASWSPYNGPGSDPVYPPPPDLPPVPETKPPHKPGTVEPARNPAPHSSI